MKFDTTKKQLGMESDKDADIGDVQDIPEEIPEGRECECIDEQELEIETMFELRDNAFNINILLAILCTYQCNPRGGQGWAYPREFDIF